jgi:Cysteine rich repeat
MKQNICVVIAAVLLLGVTGAWAQDSIVDEVMAACETEINTYCSQVTPGEGRLLACAYAHEDKLSGGCTWAIYKGVADLEAFVDAVVEVATACEADLTKFCAQVELGEGRVATCLIEHKAEVSVGCSQAMDDAELEVADD